MLHNFNMYIEVPSQPKLWLDPKATISLIIVLVLMLKETLTSRHIKMNLTDIDVPLQ